MVAEQESLVAEVNSLRAQLEITDRREDRTLSVEALEMLEVEEEVFGLFPAGFGDNGEDANDGDDDMGFDVDDEQQDSGSVRRSRRSTSRSMSNASHRTSSRSSARSAGTNAGKVAPQVNASLSPPALPESPPALSASEAESPDAGGTFPVMSMPTSYDADFLAMFSTLPSSIPAQISFGFPPTTNLVSLTVPTSVLLSDPPTRHASEQFDHSQSENLMSGYMDGVEFAFSSGDDSHLQGNLAVDEMWRFLQQHPGASLMQGADLFETDMVGGFPVPAPNHSSFPSVHVGTHGGFAV
ncbi:hypothetical protein C8R44DRAFT_745504 [Mycena epipterygia]|nr:hypothetical protein C8R44DRAFT_745504 [Mycena epipterygia]